MSKNLRFGKWFEVKTLKEHENLKKCGSLQYNEHGFARVQRGDYVGPGRYMLLQYDQRCPRNCCYDNVHEVIPAKHVASIIASEIRELAEILKQARTTSHEREVDSAV